MNPLAAGRPGLAQVLDILDRDGEEARIVGGAVRDWLVGRSGRSDVDIALSLIHI